MGRIIKRFRPHIPAKIWGLDFPEDQYAPVEREEDYWFRVELGRLRCQDATLQILGCARDIESQIHRTLYSIERIGSLFKDYRVFIYESNSIDQTSSILSSKMREDKRFIVWSESERDRCTRLHDLSPARFRQMATVRQSYVNYYRENIYGDFVCVMDMDFRGPISLNGIAHSFGYCGYWDAITANGLELNEDYYYDLATYCSNSFDEVLVEQKPGAQFANIKAGYERPVFRRGERLVKVFSAFGGMAFYRQSAFLAGSYEDYSRCDHIAFHKSLYDKGFDQIFINPSMYIIR